MSQQLQEVQTHTMPLALPLVCICNGFLTISQICPWNWTLTLKTESEFISYVHDSHVLRMWSSQMCIIIWHRRNGTTLISQNDSIRSPLELISSHFDTLGKQSTKTLTIIQNAKWVLAPICLCLTGNVQVVVFLCIYLSSVLYCWLVKTEILIRYTTRWRKSTQFRRICLLTLDSTHKIYIPYNSQKQVIKFIHVFNLKVKMVEILIDLNWKWGSQNIRPL